MGVGDAAAGLEVVEASREEATIEAMIAAVILLGEVIEADTGVEHGDIRHIESTEIVAIGLG